MGWRPSVSYTLAPTPTFTLKRPDSDVVPSPAEPRCLLSAETVVAHGLSLHQTDTAFAGAATLPVTVIRNVVCGVTEVGALMATVLAPEASAVAVTETPSNRAPRHSGNEDFNDTGVTARPAPAFVADA